jgi:choline dehydrogenase-like flavoprotein
MTENSYSAVIVGTGFASTFFLREYLKHAPASERILVLERGRRLDPAERLQRRIVRDEHVRFEDVIINRTPLKPWLQGITFGGGNCWFGNTPRMHPNDFRTRSLYGVGEDWPLTYDDLEPYYAEVEDAMGVAGASGGPYPRSKPYSFPPHHFNAFDELLAKKYPGLHIPFPSARSSSMDTGRPVCCGSGVCELCPVSAKYQNDLHMAHIYGDPRVTLLLEAEAERVDIQAGRAAGVQYRHAGREIRAKTDLAVVGAHAIMTPFILLRSGLQDRALGRYLNEQLGRGVQINLDGVDNYGGGQSVTGLGVMFLDGVFRKEKPGCLLESWNVPWLRAERGKWRQRAYITLVFEDIPSFDNYVAVSREDPSKPEVVYAKHSDYMTMGLESAGRLAEELLNGLPVESYALRPTEGLGGSAHIQGTVRMGDDPGNSVVDRDLRHHSVRNLIALGSSAFPTCPAANPTLTLSALAVRSARRLFS